VHERTRGQSRRGALERRRLLKQATVHVLQEGEHRAPVPQDRLRYAQRSGLTTSSLNPPGT